MSLDRGTKLGPYEILDPLGAGGMGEVYKARDTRLDRTVAIKVLPLQFAARVELRQRLEREARAVSSLNHPHICTLYDIGRQDGISYLVLEYIDGETLTSRLKKGPLAVDAALRYAIEIAGALDRAHRHAIVHRDLKPGNIMLTKSGAKLLDFGLAKIKESPQSGDDSTALLTDDLTSPGTILGTFQYMSPEQVEGKDADARSDIFSFGAVLYEMLTGRKAFHGASQASLIANILTAEPPPIAGLQAVAPEALDRVVRTCLAKDPDERWQSAGDLARELKWIAAAAPAVEARKARPAFIPWAVAAIAMVAAVAGFWLYFHKPVAERQSIRFTIPTEARMVSHVHISPDGTKVAFVGQNSAGKLVIWVRALDKLETQTLPGTENARYLFWSPDGTQIGFFNWPEGKMKKVDLVGGRPQVICDVHAGLGADWRADGTIIFVPEPNSGIYRVSAGGGTPVQITQPSKSTIQAFPSFFPDGRHFLFLSRPSLLLPSNPDSGSLMVGSLDSKDTKPLGRAFFSAVVSYPTAQTPAYLLFAKENALMAQQMDLDGFQPRGESIRLLDSVATEINYSLGDFSVSRNGTLAFNSGLYQTELVWLDRAGKRLSTGIPADKYSHPVLAPGGKQAVFERMDIKTNTNALWKLDVERNEISRFADSGSLPAFFPDGSAVAFKCRAENQLAICRKSAGGAGNEEIIWKTGGRYSPVDISPDGRFLSYTLVESFGDVLGILPLAGEMKPYPFYRSEYDQSHGTFSPDGKWIAYSSKETGESEVYVQPFPAKGEKWKVSTGGGAQARWRRDGKELFYLTVDGRMMAVPVKISGGFEAGVPHLLFTTPADPLYPNLGISYDVTADGQRFLINAAMDGIRTSPITIVTNWTAALAR